MNIPEDLKYTEEHEWVRIIKDEENTAYIGITDYAQGELGELVYVEIDVFDEELDKDEVFGTVEAVKTTSELFMPIKGAIVEFNEEIDEEEGDNPGLINEDPYEKGWIVKVKISESSDLEGLLNAEEYKNLIS